MIKKRYLSQDDLKTWNDYTKNPSDVYDKDKNSTNTSLRKERLKFDLHGFTLEDANIKVKELILFGSKNGYKELLLITGKGLHSTTDNDAYVSRELSKLKFSVPDFIKTDIELSKIILSISEASIKDGGKGALIIKLRNL